jgi:uncharacterized membrane protein
MPALNLLSQIAFARPEWIVIASFVAGALILLSAFSYWRSNLSWPKRCVGLLLRSLGIGILTLCLLEPMGTLERPKPQANVFAILSDRSQSLNVLRENCPSAQKQIWDDLVKDSSDWQRQLSDEYRLRRYVFDSTLEPVDSLEDICYNGTESALLGSLKSLRDRYQGRPIAGVLLFSDGQTTDSSRRSGEKAVQLKELGFPVFPVQLPSLMDKRDLRVSDVSVRQSDFETAPVTVSASISQTGAAALPARVELLDLSGKVLQSKVISFKQNPSQEKFTFQFRPGNSGVQAIRLEVVPETENTPELTLENNRRYQVVDRGRGPYRILYVAGRPNWEYKFLKRALDEDVEIELTSLIRIARKEPKFTFRDSKVDASNPLFSGFEDVSEEEKEKYDEPVYVRIGRKSADQLKKGFPKDADELFEYNAIIIDDVEAEFFNLEEQSLLRQFVAVRGGSLLALAGQESFRGKGFKNSVLSQLLPIYPEDENRDFVRTPTSPFKSDDVSTEEAKYTLTREGWLQPFLRLAENEASEKERLEKMPTFEVVNRIKGMKPGASVYSEAKLDSGETVPVFLSQKFGKGRTATLTLGDMWKWGLNHNGAAGKSPLAQSWRQMVRWLIADVPRPIEMKVDEESLATGRLVKILVDVKGVDFKPTDNAEVQVKVTGPDAKVFAVQAEPDQDLAGRYHVQCVVESEGVYIATADVMAPDGSKMGTAQTGWVHEPSAKELQTVGENKELLLAIAKETGGELVEWDKLDSFVASLQSRKVPITERVVYPLWHQGWVLGLALAALCAEWGLRRKNGLA